MNRIWTIVFSLVIAPQLAFSNGIFMNSPQSAEYIRTLSRNAATDNADIAYYNMGATALLEDGQYVNGSNITFFQRATVKTEDNTSIGSKTYVSDNPFPIFPNFYYVNKKEDRAYFCAYQTIGATATRKWDDGLPTLDYVGMTLLPAYHDGDIDWSAINNGKASSYLEGESAYYCLRGGFAKKHNNMLSYGISGRFVYTVQAVKGAISNEEEEYTRKIIIDAEDEGYGFSFAVNMNIQPNKKINIGLTYEHSTKIELETTVNSADNEIDFFKPPLADGPIFEDNSKGRLDLPPLLRMGIDYQFTSNLSASASLSIFFEDFTNFSYLGDSYKDDYGNTYEIGIGSEYQYSDKLLLGCGIGLSLIGQDEDSTTDASVPGAHSDYLMASCGLQYEINNNLFFNTGVAYLKFADTYENSDEYPPGVVKEYDKRYLLIALGLNYKF